VAHITKRVWSTDSGEERTAWRVKFTVGNKERARQFPTERKAKKFLESVSEERARLQAKGLDLDSPTFADVAESWLSARTSGSDGSPALEPATAQWYRGLLTNHILPALGPLRIGELRRSHIKAFRTQLLDGSRPNPQGTLRGKTGGPARALTPTFATQCRSSRPSRERHTQQAGSTLSRRTVQKILTTVRQVCSFALEEEILDRDPSDRVRVRHSTREARKVEIHTVSEMQRILDTAKALRDDQSLAVSKPWRRYYPMLLILVYTGLRISEVRGLKTKDIDLVRSVLIVRQRADNKGRLGSPKSAKGRRELHFPQIIKEALAIMKPNAHDLVFTTSSGRPIDTANFRKRCWEKVQQAAGVRLMTLHSCRHFFASRQISDGIHPMELSALMGHADEAFTMRTYGHLFQDAETEERRRKRAEALVLTE